MGSNNRELLIADLFCGAGGAAVGIYRACEKIGIRPRIVGFDIVKQPRYPFDFVLQDALIVDLSPFAAVWASPPCQGYVDTNSGHDRGHPLLISPTRELLIAAGKPYIIENVDRAPLENWYMLCGTMFDLRVIRHRHFECVPMPPVLVPPCHHWGSVSRGDFAAVYGRGGKGPRRRDENGMRVRDAAPVQPGPAWGDAMGIDWMNEKELSQAIPPAYSEFLWTQMLVHIGKGLGLYT